MHDLAIIPGTSNKDLAYKICENLGVSPIEVLTSHFNNGECRIEINGNIRNKDVFVVQSASNTVNDHLMELFLTLDAIKRSSCYRTTVVMPCMPYARQDRKVRSRVPISAKLIADILGHIGTDRFITAELHSPQISGFFDIPVDNLYSASIFLEHIKKNVVKANLCVVAPDAGSVKVAKKYAGRLQCEVAMIYKNRSAPGQIKEMSLIGDVKNMHCLIIDDMVDGGGTLSTAAALLMEKGALDVTAYCTHPVLSGKGAEVIQMSALKKLYVTNTIDNPNVFRYNREVSKIDVLDASGLFAEAIRCINTEMSTAHLFNEL